MTLFVVGNEAGDLDSIVSAILIAQITSKPSLPLVASPCKIFFSSGNFAFHALEGAGLVPELRFAENHEPQLASKSTLVLVDHCHRNSINGAAWQEKRIEAIIDHHIPFEEVDWLSQKMCNPGPSIGSCCTIALQLRLGLKGPFGDVGSDLKTLLKRPEDIPSLDRRLLKLAALAIYVDCKGFETQDKNHRWSNHDWNVFQRSAKTLQMDIEDFESLKNQYEHEASEGRKMLEKHLVFDIDLKTFGHLRFASLGVKLDVDHHIVVWVHAFMKWSMAGKSEADQLSVALFRPANNRRVLMIYSPSGNLEKGVCDRHLERSEYFESHATGSRFGAGYWIGVYCFSPSSSRKLVSPIITQMISRLNC